MKPAGVVGVQVRQHDPAHVADRKPVPLQLRPDLLLGLDGGADAVAVERVPGREVPRLGRAGALAGVDDDHPFGMLDREGVDRQGVGPVPVEEHVQLAEAAMAAGVTLARLDRHGSGLQRVDLHRVTPWMVVGLARER
jgi:hypothetical protein